MNDLISRQAVLKLLSAIPPEEATTKALLIQSVKQMDAPDNLVKDSQGLVKDLVNDCISRQAAIDAIDSETVSTNPEHFKSSEEFIKFMDDADIASFGKWQWANGFNTALVATTIQLKKLPSAQPTDADIQRMQDIEQAMLDKAYECGKQDAVQWIPCSERLPDRFGKMLVTFIPGTLWTYVIIANYSDLMGIAKPCFWIGNVGKNDFANITSQVVAWMPLPEPYKEVE